MQRMQEQYKADLHLLMWIASFVLLIACANLANLMLSRSVSNRQQIAVRSALGASRSRLVKRALVECLVLAMAGGLAGVLVAWGGARLIIYLAFQQDPISISAAPSPIVMGFAFAASLSLPACFSASRRHGSPRTPNPIEWALRGANRSTGRHTTVAQKTLIVAQAAVSVVLLSAAGFLDPQPGRSSSVSTLALNPPTARLSNSTRNPRESGLRNSTPSTGGSTYRSRPFQESRRSHGRGGVQWTARTAPKMSEHPRPTCPAGKL